MGLTIVLSGSANTRPQAVAALQHAGFQVDASDESHGFPVDAGLSFITVHGASVDAARQVVSHLNWALRSHWERTGPLQKVPGTGSPLELADPMKELAELKAQLRAQGIQV